MSRNAHREIEALRKQIEYHNYKYYVEDSPEVSDLEFDRLMKRLEELEAQHPEERSPDSPTQRVGGEPIKSFPPATHEIPMLSVDNSYTEDGLLEFDRRVRRLLIAFGKKGDRHGVLPSQSPFFPKPRYVAEQKIDGVSVSLLYEKGRFTRGATRGDGVRGDDITQNLRTVREIPLHLRSNGHKVPATLEVRGEIYMTNAELARLNKEQAKTGERLFANPRNAAAGSLKLLDSRLCAKRHLRFFAHSEGLLEGLKPKCHTEFLDMVRSFGIPVVPAGGPFDTMPAVIEYCKERLEERHALDYETDGTVVKVDEYAQRRVLGATSKAPRWAIALKVELWQASTRLEEIYVQVGKTGTLTPVGRLKPVAIAGSTITRVTLHNADEIARKDIRVGDSVVVEKAGKVIPHVVRVELEHRRPGAKRYRFPRKCPACGTAVVRDTDGVYIRCQNPSCPAQLKEHIRYFAHRQAMNVEGLGPSLIDQLVEKGLVRALPDVYRLTTDDLMKLERMGERSSEKLLEQIERSKNAGLTRFLTGLGIRHVGQRNARLLAEHFRDIHALAHAGAKEIAGVLGIGQVVAESVFRFFHSAGGRKTVDDFKKLGVQMGGPHAAAAKKKGPLAGKTLVVTGTFVRWSRTEIEELILELGGTATSSVSRNTDMLVAGKKPGSKLDKAKSLGVPIMTEDQFAKTIGK